MSCILETEWVRKGQSGVMECISSRRKREGWVKLRSGRMFLFSHWIGHLAMCSVSKIERQFATLGGTEDFV